MPSHLITSTFVPLNPLHFYLIYVRFYRTRTGPLTPTGPITHGASLGSLQRKLFSSLFCLSRLSLSLSLSLSLYTLH